MPCELVDCSCDLLECPVDFDRYSACHVLVFVCSRFAESMFRLLSPVSNRKPDINM